MNSKSQELEWHVAIGPDGPSHEIATGMKIGCTKAIGSNLPRNWSTFLQTPVGRLVSCAAYLERDCVDTIEKFFSYRVP